MTQVLDDDPLGGIDETLLAAEQPQEKPEPPAPVVEPVSVADAIDNVTMARVRLRKALDAQREARGRLGTSIQRWQRAVGATVSFDQLVKAHLKSENERRAAVADGKIPARQNQSQPGKSYIDRVAFYGMSGNAADFVRKQHVTGFRRGGVPASRRGLR